MDAISIRVKKLYKTIQ